MQLKILVPSRTFVQQTEVLRIVAESHTGSFGLLPHRRDCVAALVPGILTYQSANQQEVYVAVDEGLLVKSGAKVVVSVRRAIGGVPLHELRGLVKSEFLDLDEQESQLQQVLHKLESGFLKQFSELSKDQDHGA